MVNVVSSSFSPLCVPCSLKGEQGKGKRMCKHSNKTLVYSPTSVIGDELIEPFLAYQCDDCGLLTSDEVDMAAHTDCNGEILQEEIAYLPTLDADAHAAGVKRLLLRGLATEEDIARTQQTIVGAAKARGLRAKKDLVWQKAG